MSSFLKEANEIVIEFISPNGEATFTYTLPSKLYPEQHVPGKVGLQQ